MITRLALVAIAAATFALAAHADVTVKSQDGTLELTLPNGWRELTPEGRATKIAASDGLGARIIVRVYSKEDFKDIKAVANFTVGTLKLEGAEPKTEDAQVNGKPAVHINLVGTEPNGMRRGFAITVFEGDGVYIDTIGGAPASAFTKQAQVLAGIASKLKVTAGAPTNPTTTPQPTAGAPTNPPATPQPPARR